MSVDYGVNLKAAPHPASNDRLVKALRNEGLESPLSYEQQRLWLMSQLNPSSTIHNIPFGMRLTGRLNKSVLIRSLNEIVGRHEVLRSCFPEVGGHAVQKTIPSKTLSVREFDLRSLSRSDQEAKIIKLAATEAGEIFDLSRGPLFRITLIKLAESEHVLLGSMHHIVSDGWSIAVMVREFAHLYGVYVHGMPASLPPLQLQYVDFAIWQQRWLQGEVFEQQRQYWRQKLEGISQLNLSTDRPRSAAQNSLAGTARLRISRELLKELDGISRREGTTLFVTLLAALQILLSRYTGQNDIAVGTAIANRNRLEIEQLIGFFANTLVLRTKLNQQATFRALLPDVHQTVVDAHRHQSFPFDQLVQELRPERTGGLTPLIQVMFVMQNTPSRSFTLPGLKVEEMKIESKETEFDWMLLFEQNETDPTFTLIYKAELWERNTIERVLLHWQCLLAHLPGSRECAVGQLNMLEDSERYQLLTGWNATKTLLPQQCMHELFEEQARRTPDRVAIACEDRQLTYHELNRRSNQLARYLRRLEVTPDTRVAICTERTLEMVVGLLGILKAGGAYVPLDSRYPAERLRFMLEDSAPEIVLTQKNMKEQFRNISEMLRIVDLTDENHIWNEGPECDPGTADIGLSHRNLAYVIYTSGSTGQPKGVMLEHGNAANFVAWARTSFHADALERTLFSTALNFDLAVFECFVPITVGGSVRIVRDVLDAGLPPVDITLINTVPAAMNALIEAQGIPSMVRAINLAGEPLPPALVEAIFNGSCVDTVCNLYGPSETTTYSIWTAISRGEKFARNIGRPIANTSVYILDGQMEPVPVGVVGEMYIGGAGVARGYWSRAELTGERFVPDMYGSEPGARMYRTGDLGRWQENGSIEFIGRNDFQVKIRGFRIELGEIETRLMEHPGVREAVVVALEEVPGDKCLVAYYSGVEEEIAPEAEQLRMHLSARLPEYMVPAAYVCVESFPRTPNGKLDRKALVVPVAGGHTVHGYEAPLGEKEEELAGIWAEVLKLEQVGRWDNFFLLGGHSLLAVRLATRVQQSLGIEISMRDVFEHPVLADFSLFVHQKAPVRFPSIKRIKHDKQRPDFIIAKNESGRRIASFDDGFTWRDLQTGKVIE